MFWEFWGVVCIVIRAPEVPPKWLKWGFSPSGNCSHIYSFFTASLRMYFVHTIQKFVIKKPNSFEHCDSIWLESLWKILSSRLYLVRRLKGQNGRWKPQSLGMSTVGGTMRSFWNHNYLKAATIDDTNVFFQMRPSLSWWRAALSRMI